MTHQALADRTVVISGGSRGIGLAIGIAAAKQGANVVLLAKTDTPHPRLPGTVHTAAADVEAAGWPETYIATAAVTNMADGDRLAESSRIPEIMGDAAVEIVSRPGREATGNCYIDSDVLLSSGVVDLSRYGGGEQPIPDLFLD